MRNLRESVQPAALPGRDQTSIDRRPSRVTVGAIALLFAASILAPTGAAGPLCVYVLEVDSCELNGDPPRQASFIVHSSTTASAADLAWQIKAIVPTSILDPDREAPFVPLPTRDHGTYWQDWHVIYKGDAECVQITGDHWYAQGWMYLIYHGWGFLGDYSAGSGTRAGQVNSGNHHSMTAVHGSASNQAECDGLRGISFEAARAIMVATGESSFSQYKEDDPLNPQSTSSWSSGGVSTCLTGPVIGGLATVDDPSSIHTASPGEAPLGIGTAGTFSIEGTDVIEGDTYAFTGSGDVKSCLAFNAPG